MPLRIRREAIDWHHGTESLKICHLSDLHLKWNGSLKRLHHISLLLEAERPDLIAMTGDYFDTPHGAKLARHFIAQLSERYPVCWITGNHDLWYGPELLRHLQTLPHCHAIDLAPHTFTSPAGHNYQIISLPQHQQTPTDSTKPNTHRIILVHDPETLIPSALDGNHLILAGHLHGGQFNFWTTKQSAIYPGRLLYRHCCTRQPIGKDSTLIVSTGLGDTMPLRFRCPHEIVSITIR